MDDVVEPLLADREVTRADHRAQRLRGEHGCRQYPQSRSSTSRQYRRNTPVRLQWRVPLFDTSTPLAPLRDRAAREGRSRCSTAAATSSARRSAAFEREFAGYLGAGHAIGVANGTDALTLALRALGVGPGDEVVVPSFTFYALGRGDPADRRAAGVLRRRPETFCVTPETVRAALTPRTKAVIVVHLFGNVAPVAEIEALGVPVVEDAAQAAGALAADGRRAGALGTIATFSFFPSKNLGALRRRRRRGDERRRARRARADAALPRLARQGDVRARRLQLAPRRAAGRAAARRCSRTSTCWCDGRRAAAAAYEAAGPRRARELPRPAAGCDARLAPLRRAPPGAPTSSPPRSARRRSGTRPTTACRPTASPRCARTRAGAELPGHRRARAHAPRDPHEPGAQPRAGRRGRGGRARRGRE